MPAQTRILDFSGLQNLLRKLATLGAKAETIASGAILLEAEKIMAKSKKRVPVDSGNLRASGSVQGPEMSGGHMTVVLGYGGPVGVGNQGDTNKEPVNYAIVQHEDFSLSHQKVLSKKESARRGGSVTGDIGGPKYLEIPMLEAVNGMEARLGARIKRGIEDAAR